MSRCKHLHLTYKQQGNAVRNCVLACPECGMLGTIPGTEEEAKAAVARHLAKQAPTTYGFNRRARKARKARRQFIA